MERFKVRVGSPGKGMGLQLVSWRSSHERGARPQQVSNSIVMGRKRSGGKWKWPCSQCSGPCSSLRPACV